MEFLPTGDQPSPQPCSFRSAGRQAAPTQTTATPEKPAKKARTSPTASPEKPVKNRRDSLPAFAAAPRFRASRIHTDRGTALTRRLRSTKEPRRDHKTERLASKQSSDDRVFRRKTILYQRETRRYTWTRLQAYTSHVSHIHDRDRHQSYSQISYLNEKSEHYLSVHRSVHLPSDNLHRARRSCCHTGGASPREVRRSALGRGVKPGASRLRKTQRARRTLPAADSH